MRADSVQRAAHSVARASRSTKQARRLRLFGSYREQRDRREQKANASKGGPYRHHDLARASNTTPQLEGHTPTANESLPETIAKQKH
mmetsp:Transcript_62158/g.173422  ORF Transcript_62158/g.173422 Transcript_62158/m.173422 type:complete len:87 (-) Transcript_62158:33-293(-)